LGVAVVTREPASLITEAVALGEVWPEVSRALRGYLRARGSTPQDTEDVMQECALRVLHARPTFVDAPDLVRWCIPVVRNLTVDLYRRDRRETPVERLPDRPGRGDVADDVSHSLELGRVLLALQQLRPADRDAIVSHVEQDTPGDVDRKAAVRRNVQRHRARQRLLARLAGILGVIWGLTRRSARVSAPVLLPAALALGVAAGSFGAVHPLRHPETPVMHLRDDRVTPAQHSSGAGRMTRDVALSDRRQRSAPAVSSRPYAARVAAAEAPTGDGIVITRKHKDARAPLVCAQGGAGRPSVCIDDPGSRSR
jgi:DNA-directed RNA polymerase specialized sigma24 family protein